jgi:hypothetical protein
MVEEIHFMVEPTICASSTLRVKGIIKERAITLNAC